MTAAVIPVLILVGAALSGIYSAVVYRYAVTGEPPQGFHRSLIEGAFKKKGS